MEKPIDRHPKEYTANEWGRRSKHEIRFKSDPATTLDDWKEYVILGYYSWDDPAKFTKMWNSIGDEKSPTDRLARAKYVWKTYKYHTKHDLETDPKLARWATFASKLLSKNRSTRAELSKYDNPKIPEVEDKEEIDDTIDFTYADNPGMSPDTIMKLASGMTDADEKIHMRPKPIVESKLDDEDDEDDEEEEDKKDEEDNEDEEDDEENESSDEEEIQYLGTKKGTKKRRHITESDDEDEEEDDEEMAVEKPYDTAKGLEAPEEEAAMEFDLLHDDENEETGNAAAQKPSDTNNEEKAKGKAYPDAPCSPPPTKRVNNVEGTPDGGRKQIVPDEQQQKQSETAGPKKVRWVITPTKEIAAKELDVQSQSSAQDSKATDDGSIASGTTKDVKVNDGTYRFQTNWTTGKFEELKETGALWSRAIVPVLKQLLEKPKAFLHAWDAADGTMMHVKDLTEFNVRKFLSPSISPSPKNKAFYFGIRVSFTEAPPQVWLADTQTKKTMKELQIRISVSNSSCAGGELITAGYILFKEVHNCHKHRFNQSLRMNLPPSTPHFDVISCRRTETGDNVPHLAVQCGTKHVNALAEILQTYLNGATTTAVFIGRQAFMSMGKDAVKELYRIQGEFIKSLVKIPIPMLTNIDKVRNEQSDDPQERTMREWAASLRTTGGSSMQADVENGGKDRNTYLYVPKKNEEAAKEAIKVYREKIRPFHQRQERFHARIAPQGAPATIFVPTAAATANIEWIRSFTDAESHWKQAPATVRQSPGKQSKQKGTKTMQSTSSDGASPTETAIEDQMAPAATVERDDASMEGIDDDNTVATTATSHSGITTQMSDFEIQFEEIEQKLAAQAAAMQEASNQQATRMTSIEDKILASMTHNKDTNQQVTELDSKVDRLTLLIEKLASRLEQQLTENERPALPEVVPGLSLVASRTRNLEASKEDDESSTQTQSSGTINSPEHKKLRKPAPADDQYKKSSSAAGRKK